MISGQCENCLHRVKDSDNPIRCLAFPDGIPEAILTGEVDHSESYEGDQGLRYEPMWPDNES